MEVVCRLWLEACRLLCLNYVLLVDQSVPPYHLLTQLTLGVSLGTLWTLTCDRRMHGASLAEHLLTVRHGSNIASLPYNLVEPLQ